MQHLNMIDIGLVAIFAVLAVIGLSRGFVREVVSLLTFVIAFFVASLFAAHLADAFTSHETVQKLVNGASNSIGMDASSPVNYAAIAISFATIFIGVIFIGWVLGTILNILVNATALGFGNRFFGCLFGMAKGLLVTLVVIFVLQLTSVSNRDDWQDSYIVEKFQPAVLWVGKMVSPALEHMKKKTSAFFNNGNGNNEGISSLSRITKFFR